ncbi:protein FAM13A isoform X2 [Penaeus vannamei]|uniref:protein FAM13A isoform X2 n=1 Tax=Penaeus vannamei TaxID=6689 RepID=UPI00387FA9CF
MRRPSFCCDQHGSGETQCQPQEGGESTLARVRRFLAVSMGARAAGRSPTTRCKHRALPPDPLHAPAHAVHSLLAEMKEAGVGVQGVLGRPLEDVMAAHGEDASGHGVPALVHLLCCYLLTHGVDYDTLVSEDWCAEEVRTRLLLERGAAGLPSDAPEPPPGSDAAVATGLLRLFLDELPHALIPPSAATKILQLLTERGPVALPESGNLCEEALGVAVVPRLRRLLHRHLPLHSLCLLRYLTAFIHQLRTSNHNTCPVPVSALSRVLARVMVAAGDDNGGRGDDDDDDRRPQESQPRLANRLGEILILCYNDIFQNTDDDGDDLSDSVSSPSSVGECVGDGDEDDDDEGDTTTTDTDDFRSPPVSPQKTARPRGTATSVVRPPPLSLHQPPMSPRLPELGRGSGGASSSGGSGVACGGAWAASPAVKPLALVPLDLASPVTFDPGAPPSRAPADPQAASAAASAGHEDRPDTSADDALRKEQPPKEPLAEEAPDAFPGSLHRKRKEHADGKEGGEHDPKFIRSTREVVDHLDSIRPKVAPYSKELLVGPGVGPLLSPASPDDSLPSTQDEDEDATSQSPESSCVSAQDYWETGGESDLRDESERDEEEEEDFGGGGGGGGGLGVNDSHEERRLNERSFPRSYPQSSRRPRRRTKKRHHSHSPQREPSLGLSELLNAGEPVTSDRGSWGMRESSHCDSWHRTAPRYSRFDDESTMQSNWYRSDEDDIILSPRASEAFKDVGPANGSDDYKTPPGQGAVKILMKNINSIKKKIKRYEEEFESAFGYRPSHSEKMKHKEIKKYMSELSKARKELKQMKDDVAGMMSVPTVFPLSLLRCQESTNPNARPKNTSGTADTIRQVEDRLREKRSASGRPTELTNMNKTEMQEEKTALQKALLYYESVHGRPTTREDRDLARPLYDRYRQVKRIVMRSSSRAKENMVELAPILEHEAMDFTLASPQHRGSLQGDEIEKISLPPSPPSTPPVFESPVFEAPQMTTTTTTTTTMPGDDPKDTRRGVPLGDLHALPLSELRERKKEARDEKKKLRRALREFEENFERDLGRKVQKEDRGPMEQTYLDYKHAKAKLRLLEALLSKHEPHKV